MNTRLQVEHGITEMCYDVDLVELMLKQADAQLAGKGGLTNEWVRLPSLLERYYPASHHIEVQVFGNGQGRAIHFGERE